MITLLLLSSMYGVVTKTAKPKISISKELGRRASGLGERLKQATAFSRTSNYYRAAKNMLEENTPKYIKEYGALKYRIGETLASIHNNNPLVVIKNLKAIAKQLHSLKIAIDETRKHIESDIQQMEAGKHINNAKEIKQKLSEFEKKFSAINSQIIAIDEKLKHFAEENKTEIKEHEEKAAATRFRAAFKQHQAKPAPTLGNTPPSEPIPTTIPAAGNTATAPTAEAHAGTITPTSTPPTPSKTDIHKKFNETMQQAKSNKRKAIARKFFAEHPEHFKLEGEKVVPK